MRTKTIQVFFLAIAAVAFITSCNHSGKGFETDSKTGVVYRFIKHDDNGVKGTDSGYARVVLSYSDSSLKGKDGKDSIMFNSRKRSNDSTGTIVLALKKSFNGCLEQGILMMSAGDSAQFQINSDSLYIKTFHAPPDRLPPGVHGKTYIFQIKLVSFVTKKEMMDEQNKQRQQYMEKMMARKAMEKSSIADYLKNNHYENVKPTSDSIYVLERTKGKGRQVKEGDSLQVVYVGTLLDGTVFDNSDKGPGHTTLPLLYSQDQNKIRVIQGWIKVLATMHEGEKVKVLIPSAMAYGPRSQGPITPFTPLVFDMTLVSIKSNKK